MTRTSILVGFAALLAATTGPARAQSGSSSQPTVSAAQGAATPAPESEVAPASEAQRPGPFVIGAGFGALFPQPFSQLGSHVVFGLEFGYRLSWLEQRIEIMVDVGYTPPGRAVEIARTEGTYQAEVTLQQLFFSLGPRVRVMPGSSPWNVTVAVGPRLFLLQSSSSGSRDGQAFVEFTEQSTEIGLFAAVGGEYRLGPGALFLELSLGWSELPHRIMGDPDTGNDVSAGNLALTLGYRLFI